MDSNELGKEIGAIIGKLRLDAGETQQELADSLGVKRETVNQWENGTRQIKAEAIRKLAQHFNTSADFLLGLTKANTGDKNLQFVCDYTGLSENSIRGLLRAKRFFHKKDASNTLVNNFVSGYFSMTMLYLSRVQDSAEQAKEILAQTQKDYPDLNAFKGNLWDIINPLSAAEDALGMSLFRFSRFCDDIPDCLYNAGNTLGNIEKYRTALLYSRGTAEKCVEEIDAEGNIKLSPLENNNGEHQEN